MARSLERVTSDCYFTVYHRSIVLESMLDQSECGRYSHGNRASKEAFLSEMYRTVNQSDGEEGQLLWEAV